MIDALRSENEMVVALRAELEQARKERLTPDEVMKVREAFELWATAHHLSGHEIDVRGEALSLLAGKGQA